MRVVVDTNVVVSGCLTPAGLPAKVLESALLEQFELFVSDDVLKEYQAVLDRPKFDI
jgi:putative PIN family toxin of toxin-antitoxin system